MLLAARRSPEGNKTRTIGSLKTETLQTRSVAGTHSEGRQSQQERKCRRTDAGGASGERVAAKARVHIGANLVRSPPQH